MTGSRRSFRPGGGPSTRPKGETRKPAPGSRDAQDTGEADLAGLGRRLDFLKRCDAEDPNSRWFLPLAAGLRDLGRFEEAAVALRRGLACDPDCLGGWVVLGQCYLGLGEVEVAKSLLQWIADRDPENTVVLRGLATIHAREGDHERAADCCRALLRLKPRDLEAQAALASLLDPSPPEPEPVPPPPPASTRVLSPQPRLPGIFEPPPADLEADGPESLPRGGRTKAEPAAPARTPPRRSLEGYRRWLERMTESKANRDEAGRPDLSALDYDPDRYDAHLDSDRDRPNWGAARPEAPGPVGS